MPQDRFSVKSILSSLFLTKCYWLALFVLGLLMEGGALYYQHVLGEEPCQVCIHIRILTAAFMLLSAVMLVLPSTKLISLSGHLINSLGMMWLWERCWFLLSVENGNATSSCNFYLGFPDWFALDKWFPEVFEVRALCSFTPELLFGISMAQGLITIASVLVLASISLLIINSMQLLRS